MQGVKSWNVLCISDGQGMQARAGETVKSETLDIEYEMQ